MRNVENKDMLDDVQRRDEGLKRHCVMLQEKAYWALQYKRNQSPHCSDDANVKDREIQKREGV